MEQSNSTFVRFWYTDINTQMKLDFPLKVSTIMWKLLKNATFPININVKNLIDNNKEQISFPMQTIQLYFTTPISGIANYPDANLYNIFVETNWQKHKYFDAILINKYYPWTSISRGSNLCNYFDIRLNHTLNNCAKAIHFLQTHTKQELKNILKNSIKYIINENDNFFDTYDKKLNFMSGNLSLTLNVKPNLSGALDWCPYINNNLNIWYNYTIFPSANNYNELSLDKYFSDMRNAIKLTLSSMSVIGKIFVFNPIGMGAFMSKTKMDTNMLKKKIIHILLEEYSSIPNNYVTKLLLVMKGIISENDYNKIVESVFKNNMHESKSILWLEGDMIDYAMNEKQFNMNEQVIITMAGDIFGPSNRCLKLPECNKNGNAKSASDENNTRRSYEAIFMCILLLLWHKFDTLDFSQFTIENFNILEQQKFAKYIYQQCNNRKKTLKESIEQIML